MFIFRIFLSLIFLSLFSTNLFAQNKVAYINVDLILTESLPAKSMLSQLKLIEKTKIEKINNDEIELKNEEKKILASKNIISNDEYNKNVKNFQKKVDLHRKLKDENIKNLKQKRNKEILRFFNLINPIIEKVMEKNSIAILIEKKNIFIAKSNYDITEIVIEEINKDIKDFLIE
jgi:Skp family chaperone for outer membrane proteins